MKMSQLTFRDGDSKQTQSALSAISAHVLLENVEHCGGEPEQAGTIATS